jgi:hypothetical protein
MRNAQLWFRVFSGGLAASGAGTAIAAWMNARGTGDGPPAIATGLGAVVARPGPVNVPAARGGVLIDGLLFPLAPRGIGAMTGLLWLETPPECIEVELGIPQSISGGGIRSMPGHLRIPVAPEAREGAVSAFGYYRALLESGELSDQRPHRLAVRIAFWGGLLLLAAGLAALTMEDAADPTLAIRLTAVIGIACGIAALCVAGVVWQVMLRK